MGKRQRAQQVYLSCLGFNLRKAARAMSSRYDEALRPLGLRITQFSLLSAVDYDPGASITQLADWLGTDRTTLQRNIAILERDKLVKIDKTAKGNVRSVTLTAKGSEKLAAGYRAWQKAHNDIKGDVGADELKRLLAMLRSLA